MIRALFFLMLLLPGAALAQESDPFALVHPATGEPGVWLPVGVQQSFLQDAASLESCNEERSKIRLSNTELRLALVEKDAALDNFQQSIDALKVELTVARTEMKDAKGREQRWLYLALGSTGAAVVAISILLIEHL